MNILYKHLWRIAIALIPVCVIVTSCDDEETVKPVEIQFSAGAMNVAESGEQQSIVLPLAKAAGADGTVEIEITGSNAVYGENFITSPAGSSGTITLEVAKGQTSAQFTITPVDDELLNETRTVTFKLVNPSNSLVIGTQSELVATLTDNEGPTQMNFWTDASEISESAAEPSSLTLELSAPAPGTGTTTVNIESNGVYGTDFTTTPAAAGGVITLETAVGDEEETITFTPLNDEDVNANITVTFTVSTVSGVVEKGTALTHTVTIIDDEIPPTTISNLRAMHAGSDVTIATGTNIRGVVTSKNDNITSRNLYLQDATGAMLVRFATNNTFAIGDDLVIDLSGATLTSFNGNLQVAVANEKAVKKGTATLPDYQTVTVTEFTTNLNTYEGELVQIQNVGFVDADGTLTMNGSRNASDGTTQFVVRSESYSPWNATAIPYGVGVIRGIATEFNGASQLVPQVFADDIVLSTAGKSITITQAITNFGSVTKGSTSASQSFTLSGSGLVADVVVTAPSNFTVSKNNTDFTSSVTFTAAEASSSQTVYVKFAPNSGIDQALQGSISVKSIGAEAKSFVVNGTESGNAAGATRLMNENFDYSAANGDAITTASGGAWANHSGTQNPTFNTTGLTYAGYGASGIGGAMNFTKGGSGVTDGDVNRTFTKIDATGDVYVSFLLNVSAAQATSDYFFHFSTNPLNSSFFRGRLHARSNGAGYSLGLVKNAETRVDNTTVLNFNQTYLIVFKYSFSTVTTSDDQVKVFVYETGVPSDEASPTLTTIGATGSAGTGDPTTDVGSIAVRQGTNTPTGVIDGIRVAKLWADLFN
jgi:hypothetical protein